MRQLFTDISVAVASVAGLIVFLEFCKFLTSFY